MPFLLPQVRMLLSRRCLVGISSWSWCELLNRPGAVGLQAIEKTIMQPVGATLPKLYFGGDDAVTAPERGQRYLTIRKFALYFRPFHLQHLAGRDNTALGRDPGCQLAAERPFN